jgi:Ca2+/H+ antiporter, TMEM165/GDT1 family
MADVLTAFAVVFLAELGDKTQLVALTLAGRYPALKVLLALGAAIVVLKTLSVTVGAAIGEAVPDRAIAVAAGLLFLGFAVWTWRSAVDDEAHDADDADLAGPPPDAGRAGLVGVTVAFFLAELGDKTMLATAGLAADRSAVAVWLGAVAAMLAATTLAVLAGRSLMKKVRPATLRKVGAGAFLLVGLATLAGVALG